MIWWAWLAVYFLAYIMVPAKKLCRGYATRYFLAKLIPPKRFWRTPPANHTYRYFLWVAINMLIQYGVGVSHTPSELLFWTVIIGLLLDDYINGDDDPKKRWEGVKNKVKWLMDLPRAPEPGQVSS